MNPRHPKQVLAAQVKATPFVTLQWEPAGCPGTLRKGSKRETYHLYSSVVVNGLPMHVEAIEVKGENSTVAVAKDLQNWVDAVGTILDECPTTLLIDGRHYIVTFVPYSCS